MDWDGPRPTYAPRPPVILIVSVVLLAMAVGAVLGPVIGVLAAAVMLASMGGVARRAAVRPVAGTEPVSEGDEARLLNLVQGKAADLGVSAPEVRVFATGPPNAVASGGRLPVIAFRRTALDSFSRTELEAAVSFLLVALATGAARVTALPRWVGGRDVDLVGLDIAAASATRYPPALSRVLAACEPADGQGLWLVPGGDDVEARRRALAEL